MFRACALREEAQRLLLSLPHETTSSAVFPFDYHDNEEQSIHGKRNGGRENLDFVEELRRGFKRPETFDNAGELLNVNCISIFAHQYPEQFEPVELISLPRANGSRHEHL